MQFERNSLRWRQVKNKRCRGEIVWIEAKEEDKNASRWERKERLRNTKRQKTKQRSSVWKRKKIWINEESTKKKIAMQIELCIQVYIYIIYAYHKL